MERFTVGDSFTKLEVEIVDQNKAVRDITGWVLRLFVEGAGSDDRPADSATKTVTGCGLTKGVAKITRLTGSFSADGVAVGSVPVLAGVPEGTQVLTVSALEVTLDQPATADATGVTAVFWFGVLLAHSGGDDTAGLCRVAIGPYLNPGARLSDVYRGTVRADVPGGTVAWGNTSRGVVEFEGVRP
jgi:hypothetical protein